jgi:hypothetical protein
MKRVALAALLLVPGIALARTHIGLQSPAEVPAQTDAPLAISLNFTDPVPGFGAASTTLVNATIDDFVSAGNDRDFSLTLTPVAEGAFSLEIVEGTVGDNNIDFLLQSAYALSAPREDATSTEASSTPPAEEAPAAPQSGGAGATGSGSSGALPHNAIIPAPAEDTALPQPAEGEVLGAATFSFTGYLARGMDGSAVLSLQKVLINLGFLGKGYAIGHFGPRTEAATAAYQRARGLEQTGAMGPRTRAALNAEDLSIL